MQETAGCLATGRPTLRLPEPSVSWDAGLVQTKPGKFWANLDDRPLNLLKIYSGLPPSKQNHVLIRATCILLKNDISLAVRDGLVI